MEKSAYRNLRKALKKLNYRKVKSLARNYDKSSPRLPIEFDLPKIIESATVGRITQNKMIMDNIGLNFPYCILENPI